MGDDLPRETVVPLAVDTPASDISPIRQAFPSAFALPGQLRGRGCLRSHHLWRDCHAGRGKQPNPFANLALEVMTDGERLLAERPPSRPVPFTRGRASVAARREGPQGLERQR